MKKIFFLILILGSQKLHAQDTTVIHLKHVRDTIRLKRTAEDILITDRPPQAVFVELGGRSITVSGNYDARFSKRVDGLGYSVGIGYTEQDSYSLFSIPVSINYLMGDGGKYFEVGGGVTYFNKNIEEYFDDNYFGNQPNIDGSSLIGTLSVGYRRQPIRGGFVFRTGLSLLGFHNNFVPTAYLGFGYSF